MLTVCRRHRASCKHRSRRYKGCSCPIWVQGVLRDKPVRKSLDVTSWEAANRLVREWEIKGSAEREVLVREATERFIVDSEARHLKTLTIKKYKEIKRLLDEAFGDLPIGKISVDDLRRLREGWELSANSSWKRVEHLRGFFSFCAASGWIEKNPAKALRAPKIDREPTLPFSEEEWKRILWALDAYEEIHPQSPVAIQKKLKALVLLMRYSGLRISDAVALTKNRIDKAGRLLIRQEKTRHPVMVPLPKNVLRALEECDDGCYFWPGTGKLDTALGKWHLRLKRVFVIAGVPDGHGHRLRDSFAVELLSRGVDIQTVSVLLGHRSVRTTELYYAPWVKSRQDALEAAVKKSWSIVSSRNAR